MNFTRKMTKEQINTYDEIDRLRILKLILIDKRIRIFNDHFVNFCELDDYLTHKYKS
jgi:hypothetical protein